MGKTHIDIVFDIIKECPKCKKAELSDKDRERILFRNKCESCINEEMRCRMLNLEKVYAKIDSPKYENKDKVRILGYVAENETITVFIVNDTARTFLRTEVEIYTE